MELELLPDAPVLVGLDFNINRMAAIVAQRAGEQIQVFDEIVLTNSNTPEMMREINRIYAGRHGVVHPDPSGVARKTSAPVGKTDFRIIEEAGWTVFPAKQYKVVDRINTVNAKLCNAQGQRRLLISPKCKNLIKALDGLTYKNGTKIPDKSSGLDHVTDALGYLLMGLFPTTGPNWGSTTVSIYTRRRSVGQNRYRSTGRRKNISQVTAGRTVKKQWLGPRQEWNELRLATTHGVISVF